VDDGVRAWLEATVGGRVLAEARPPIGGSRTVYLVDVEREHDTVPMVVRCEGEGSFTGTEVSLAREATVYRALTPTAVPTPALLGVSPDASVILLERVSGSADLPPVGSDERIATMASFVDAVADLHGLDLDDLELPGFAVPRTAADHARLDLALWARLGHLARPLDPLLRYAGAWLWTHPPAVVPRTVLVQGDTGPGNFLAADGRVTGLVDWEFAHVGDPMDDWAWIEMRSDPAELPALHERYTRRSGIDVDPERIAYYRLAVQYRCAITTTLAVRRGQGARGRAPYLLATQRFLDGVARALAERCGVALDPAATLAAPGDSPRTALYDELLAGVRGAVASLDDPDVREATRNLQILVRHLRAVDRFGGVLEHDDHDDRAAVFGGPVDDDDLGELAEHAGGAADSTVLAYLLRRHRRERQLWADLLDRARRG
jgi:aminoglycoside phosphotransferase (APT) family kinase protein